MNDLHDLELLLRSDRPILSLESVEEPRILSLFAGLAMRLKQPAFYWTLTGGLARIELDDTASYADLAGLDNLKAWLDLRRGPFLGRTKVKDYPRGILLLGVQGSGKSLAAKAAAGRFGVPLLRMDFAALYDKFYGETERNLRRALQTAEVMAPCVLWLDEIEKGLAAGSEGDGLGQRILGTLLTWMAERKTAVFLVATSNDITRLPPELVRKGRLDDGPPDRRTARLGPGAYRPSPRALAGTGPAGRAQRSLWARMSRQTRAGAGPGWVPAPSFGSGAARPLDRGRPGPGPANLRKAFGRKCTQIIQ
jgi:hypothetical protein